MPQYQGMWTVQKAAQLQGQQQWVTDPQFDNTVLLLQADNAANAAQNNTFLDSSANAFAVTRVGNTTQGSFTPFSQAPGWWSVYFNGGVAGATGITVTDAAALRPNTSNFTVEFWINFSSLTGVQSVFAKGGTAANQILIQTSTGTGTLTVLIAGTTVITASSSSSVGVWDHYALVRSVNTYTLYRNGVSVGTGTNATSISTTANLTIGSSSVSPTLVGYMSNLRFTIGAALYTSSFTPSLFPLTTTSQGAVDTQVELLTCQSNRAVDNSINNFGVGNSGVFIQPFSPFAPPYQYIQDTQGVGWSNYFDGAGDYLEVANNTALLFGTGDFTVEAWVYSTALQAANAGVVAKGGATAGYTLNVTGTAVSVIIADGSTTLSSSSGFINLNTWTHIAFVRSSGVSSLYVNGVSLGSVADSHDYNNTPVQRIGTNRTAGADFTGYISNVRIVKGTALYTGSTFIVPNAPLTAVSGTSLLTCQSNSIVDNSPNAFAITVTGTPSIQFLSPYSSQYATGGSAYFDGTGDYLSVANNARLQLGTSAFTIQAWIYRSVSGVAHSIIAKGGGTTGFVLQVSAADVLQFTHGSTTVNGTTLSSGTWVHVAAVRTGTGTNGFRLLVNGVGVATATVATNFTQTDLLYVGADRTAGNVMNGYISGLKFTNGTAESIPVPVIPPTVTPNVALLTNFTNAAILDGTMKNDFETLNQAQISTAVVKYGSGSIAFDGSDDYVVAPYSPLFNFGTGQFTIECWVNFTALTTNRLIFDTYTAASAGGGYQLFWRQTGTSITFYANGVVVAQSSFTAHTTNVWYHVAVTRDTSNVVRIFVDGTQYASVTYATAIDMATTGKVAVGIQASTSTNDLAGYVDDLRVTKGVARYTANFTPPQVALQRQ